jgi:hypothetical protein
VTFDRNKVKTYLKPYDIVGFHQTADFCKRYVRAAAV